MNYRVAAFFCALLVGLAGCGKSRPPDAPPTAPAPSPAPTTARDADGTVSLTADERTHAGILVTRAIAMQYVPEVAGFGIVLGREQIAQALTDMTIAQAALKQSRAVLARMRSLAGTAGADSAEARESAERQATADAAAVRMAESKAASTLGQQPPWLHGNDPRVLDALAAGRDKILRVTFPLGAVQGGLPRQLRFARLDAAASDAAQRSSLIWEAPADAGIPGRAYFALLDHPQVVEGERLLVWATTAQALAPLRGVLIPASAAIISDNRYWCYVERQSGVFVRVALDVSRPQPTGYFVSDELPAATADDADADATRIAPGDNVVTRGAGLLLAHESQAAGSGGAD